MKRVPERVPEGEAISKVESARRYNQAMSHNEHMQREYREMAQAVIRMGVPQGGKVLDLGTGPGFIAIEIARLLQGKAQVIGLDLSQAMLEIATENARREGLDGSVAWREGNAKSMPFSDGEFDFVVSSGSLHHWEDPPTVFDEIARVLKDDGKLIVGDLKRLQSWGSRLFAWAIGLSIPGDFRVHYWNSIRAAYTAPELRQILERSQLRGWRLNEGLMDITVLKGG